eukprot:CAMPEP_0197899598 /NCGR_PEP_ID=MMETSP1439-20131203/46899_1 /TAXON_ID=66791 /ORGANISM="Gonyaulax spinifera, Strain CCMP409" /LENGTH=30 /DNA_ID= /DNA_START= /DNA_END= /DNA_ORIENTATION=
MHSMRGSLQVQAAFLACGAATPSFKEQEQP